MDNTLQLNKKVISKVTNEFWSKQLTPLPTPLRLPYDGKRSVKRSNITYQVLHLIEAPKLRTAKKLAMNLGVDFYSVGLSAFAILCHRISKATDFIVGIPASNPNLIAERNSNNSVGVLPIRCHIEPDNTFAAVCHAIDKSVHDARRHVGASLQEVLTELNISQDPEEPLVAIVFSLVNKNVSDQLNAASSVVASESAKSQTQYFNSPDFEDIDLNLIAIETENGLEFEAQVNRNSYKREWLIWRLRELECLLLGGCESPETAVDDLNILPEIEKRFIWETCNRFNINYPKNRTVSQLFEEQAQRTPQSVAIQQGNESLSYQVLDRRSNQLAHALRRLNVQRGSLVGICLERKVEMVVAMLGILKTGAAYVPLDPKFPADRLSFMVEDSKLAWVISEAKLAQHHRCAANCTYNIDVQLDALAKENCASLEIEQFSAQSEAPAYLLYTSGSTGKPKGVLIPHRAAVNFLSSMQSQPGIKPFDRLLAVTTLSFDIAFLELMLPLTIGAQIILASQEEVIDGEALRRLIQRHQITFMQATPATWRMLLESGWEGNATFKALCGGEALPLDLAAALLERVGELWNMYGPTETTVWSSTGQITSAAEEIHIGKPIANTSIWILDSQLDPCPIGVPGEVYIGGEGVALEYLNRPELTAERFINDPFSEKTGARLYRTGDLGRWRTDGNLECLGRTDFQIKIRGFRIELGEIENAIANYPGVKQAVVIARQSESSNKTGETVLVAYLVANDNSSKVNDIALRTYLKRLLPEYMVPSYFVFIPEMPLTPNGKIDRQALPKNLADRPELSEAYIAPRTKIEKELCNIWSELLNLNKVGIRDNFFDLGGNSLLALRLTTRIRKIVSQEMPVVRIFEYPTVEKLAAHLSGSNSTDNSLFDGAYERATRFRIGRLSGNKETDGVAVIGIVGRFPGAQTIEELWSNLCSKKESISRFSLEELGPGIDEETKNDPNYIPTRGIIDDADKFDASFFGIGPLEAKVIDPQQRVFLELAWAALENAGYDCSRFNGLIGVYAGVGDNHYYHRNVLCHPDIAKTVGNLVVEYGNEKDYVAMRVSYALNLTGPSVSANSACSTSLLAIDNAFKALVDFECDMALAGGVDICVPQKSGQLYQEGGTFTKDGHCRPFDEKATGTMFCDGAGVVVLRRLEDAIAAGDHIYAVLLGSAKNNDGSNKVSFLAPSVEGQSRVIALAQAQANVLAETISYVEAHGTGTPVGDPIEVEALTRAFRATTNKKQFCYLGSIKGNIGHPTNAAGVAGFIKASLALHHETIPATLHYERPNPKIDFENSPFKVVNETTPWPRSETVRRASVSSFGFGGTNVHAVLEEAPLLEPSGPSRPMQLLPFSAKTEAALARIRQNYADFLTKKPAINLADMAYTLQVGRKYHPFRDFIVCNNREEAIQQLAKTEEEYAIEQLTTLNSGVVFMFPGQGSQYVNMGRALYNDEPEFRHWVDACCDILKGHLDRDLRELLFPDSQDEVTATIALKDTYYTQPALFTIEYALAKFWMSLGIQPVSLIGHSVGEFVCACLAGVFSLEDAISLVALRGRLIRELPRGSMMSVRCAAENLVGRLPADVQLAASNGPKLCVVAGPIDSVAALSQILESESIVTTQLHTSHAFHSAMMAPAVAPFIEAIRKVRCGKPTIPFMSTCNADWVTENTTLDAEYWGQHMRKPVLFSASIAKMLHDSEQIFLEVGPRDVLSTLARQHAHNNSDHSARIFASMGSNPQEEWARFLGAVGELWKNGVSIDWNLFYNNEKRYRIPLPTYPFEKKSYWLEPVDISSNYSKEALSVCTAIHIEDNENENAHPVKKAKKQGHRDEIMGAIASMLEETLGINLKRADENRRFDALGADSLLLMQLSRMVQTRLEFPVTFRKLTEQYPSPAQLAEAIKLARAAAITSEAPKNADIELAQLPHIHSHSCPADNQSLPSSKKEGRTLVSTPAQMELWLSAQTDTSANCAYNGSFTIHLTNAEEQALAWALQELPNYHEALRGRFSNDGEHFIIDSQIILPITYHDLSALSCQDQQKALQQIEESDSQTPYSLEKGPLFRASISCLGSGNFAVLMAAHHAVCDGWSLDVLLSDFAKLYSAFIRKSSPPALPEHQFSDFVGLCQSLPYLSQIENSRAFWGQKLNPLPPNLSLPYDGRRPAMRSYNAHHLLYTVDSPKMLAAKNLALELGVSFFSVQFSALATLIHRISGETNFVIGVPVASQPDVGMETAVGHLVNMLPIRCCIQPDYSFASICRENNSAILDAREHAAISFGEIVTELGVPRDPARVPLIAVTFTHVHKYAPGKVVFEGSEFSYSSNFRAFETFELSLVMIESHDGLEFRAHINADLYSRDWLQWRLHELDNLLQSGCNSPQMAISQLGLLPESELKVIGKELNCNNRDYPQDIPVTRLFEEQAQRRARFTAITQGNESISYQELDARSNQLAHALRRINVQRGELVGLCLERTIDMVIAVLGVLKTGAAYIPLDPKFPAERLAFMVEDSGLSRVISKTWLAKNHGCCSENTFNLDTEVDSLARESTDPITLDEHSAQPNDPAYVIYTSGSTGRPKGVCVPHRAAVNFLCSMRSQPGMEVTDRLLAVTTLSFDIALLELMLPLTIGAQIVLANQDEVIDGEALRRLIEKYQITYMQATPATWRLLVESGWKGSAGFKALCGGEALSPELAAALLKRVDELWNMYGPTETTVWSTIERVINLEQGISIGKPIANTSVWILDSDRRLCPIGVPGEIFIGGDGVALGYLNRPELTLEKFISIPPALSKMETKDGSRLYKTGDLGRWRVDGRLECLGRTDFQVKIRGFRIELGEIESVLASYPDIKQAVVVARGNDANQSNSNVSNNNLGDTRLIAYVLPNEDISDSVINNKNANRADEIALRAHLKRSLPDYMIPTNIVRLESFPLTPNGKVDRNALPEPENAPVLTEYVEPRDEREKLLAIVWQKVLNLSRVGAHDNFFELGGQSILAARVVAKLKRDYNIQIPIRNLFAAPTIAQLGQFLPESINTHCLNAAPAQTRKIPLRQKSDPIVLSLMQQRIWFLEQLEPGKSIHNLPAAYRLCGNLNVDALERALDSFVLRHDVLRTAFVDNGSGPMQVVHALSRFKLNRLTLLNKPDSFVRRQLSELCNEPFDLNSGMLFRAWLADRGNNDYILAICAHHIAWDGSSFSIFLKEIDQLYDAFSKGKDFALPELPITYADFTAWQHANLTDDALEAHLAFWREHLSGELPVLNLPTDKPRPAVQEGRGGDIRFHISRKQADALTALALRENATLYMVLLAAFKVLIHRYSGQNDIVVGVPVQGREHPDTENLIGFFVDTLALRTRFSSDISFATLLKRVKNVCLDCFAHQEAPFQKIVEELQLPRDVSRTPVYQAIFSFLDQRSKAMRIGDFVRTDFPIDLLSATTDLTLLIIENVDGLFGVINYDSALFERETAVRLSVSFSIILEAILADLAQPLYKLPILSETEQKSIAFWNNTEKSFNRNCLVHELVAEQVARSPEAIAISFNGISLTYAELDERAARLANYLISLGAGPGLRIAVSLERSLEMVVAIYAVLKTGAAYVPLDPAFPSERIAFMLEDSGAFALITQQSLRQKLPAASRIVCVDDDDRLIASCSSEPMKKLTFSGESVAYVIYTSGSTGKPKGVQIPHRALANFLLSMQTEPGLSSQDTLLAVTTLSFDIAGLELWLPLIVGARIAIASRETTLDGDLLCETLKECGATVMQATPSTWRLLISAGWQGSPKFKILVGGEALPADLAQELMKRSGSAWNMYGPTETTVWSTCWRIPVDSNQPIVIGKPIANTQTYVLDDHLQQVPIGVVGNLYIGGQGLALGYLNRPDLTSKQFVPVPTTLNQKNLSGNKSLYRTGDMARFRIDGNLEYLGRADHQVKIRGFRIELGEIESVLAHHPRVKHAVVIAHENSGDARLIGYVILNKNAADNNLDDNSEQADDIALRAHLKRSLPDYMVPPNIVRLESFPLTPNGKVDRNALPIPDKITPALTEYVEPENEREKLLAIVWQEILNLSRVGVHDNFFELGGQSLLAAKLMAKLKRDYGIQIPIRNLFIAPTIAQLAQLLPESLEASRLIGSPLQTRKIPPRRESDPIILSLMQQRIWFLEQLEPGKSVHNLPAAYRLRGNLNIDALERALDSFVQRHQALRTAFVDNGNGPVQVVHVLSRFKLNKLNLLDKPDSFVRHHLSELCNQPFDLKSGMLFRAWLADLGNNDYILAICAHHISWDGSSFSIFLKEIDQLYGAFSEGKELNLPELPITYADFTAWQHTSLTGDTLEAHLAFWREHLSGELPVLNLPTDKPRPAVQDGRGGDIRFHISRTQADALTALALSENVTLYMVLLAAFKALIYRYSGQNDIIIGVPIQGREHPDTENLIGFFVDTLALRTRFSGEISFASLLERVKNVCLDCFAHQEAPFQKIVQELQLPRDRSRTPVYQAMFSFLDQGLNKLNIGGLAYTDFHLELLNATTDLTLLMFNGADGFSGVINYDSALFERETAERLSISFSIILEAIVADLSQPLHKLPILSERERKALVFWNNTARQFDRSCLAHELVAEQVARSPEAIAISYNNISLTYAELDERAARLANYLVSLGAGPGLRIAVSLERSLEMVIAIYAVLKAGATYVPLDPAFPAERIAFMLEDSGAFALITQQSLRQKLPAAQRTISIDGDAELIAKCSAEPIEKVAISDESVAYVIYTSGSTGKPKGVQIPHRALTNFLLSMETEPGISSRDILLAVTTLSFDIAGLELWLPLIVGARIEIASREATLDGYLLGKLLNKCGATVMQATPSTWRLLIAAGWQGSSKFKILVGGEALPADLAQELVKRSGSAWNMYGPTETTIWSTCWRIPVDSTHPIVIGKPIANTQIFVLDNHMQPVPIGVIGNLYIGGQGLAIGYLNRPELTAQQFVPAPAALSQHDFQSNALLYRTGDTARFRIDGTIEFLGRADYQVKVRGFRIELGEIESVLMRNPSIKQAVAIVREDNPGDMRLVAYLVSRTGIAIDIHSLREYMSKSLPEYMVPQHFIELKAMPLTPNGKIDRKALPAPKGVEGISGGSEIEMPKNPTEKKLANIWKNVLNIPNISVTSNFFDLGGHSLLAVRIFNEIFNEFGVRLPLAALFEQPTVRLLAKKLRDLNSGISKSTWNTVVPIQPKGSLPPLFCVSGLGGTPLNLRTLTTTLGENQPFYGLQHRGVDGRLPPHTSIADMAKEFISDIRRVQSSGPYYLAGYSAGGLAAYEMARLLLDVGEEVAGVILLDSSNPLVLHWSWGARVSAHMTNFRRVGMDYLSVRAKEFTKRAYSNSRRAMQNLTTSNKDYERRHDIVSVATLEAERQYVPTELNVDVVLLKSDAAIPAIAGIGYPPHESNGWRPLVKGRLEIEHINCFHLDMIAEKVAPTTGSLMTKALCSFRERVEARRLSEAKLLADE